MNTDTSATPETSPPENWLVSEFKKQTITICFALVWAFYTFVWNSQTGQTDLKHQLQDNTKQIEKLNITVKEMSDANTQLFIQIAKTSESQSYLVAEVKRIQENQQRNTEQLNRK